MASFSDLRKHRTGMRLRDIAESRQLLYELVTHDPTIIQCLGILEAVCLSHGIHCKIDEEPVSDEFRLFLDRQWTPFLRESIRSFFAYGFVPWTVRRDADGEDVPVVIPVGSFDWWTEVRPTSADAVIQEEDPGLLCYHVRPEASLGVKDHDISIYRYYAPSMNVTNNSFLSATVSSPLAHVLTDYKNMRQAQLRRAYADTWNTTAKLICSFKPAQRVQEDPSACLMDFADDSYLDPSMHLVMPGIAPLQATNVWTRDAQIRKQFAGVSVHEPDIFTLPKDHDVTAQPMLTPCEDVEFLMAKFQRDVCAIVGIPEEMVLTHTKARMADTVHRTLAAGRIFSCNMKQLCFHLQSLSCSVYRRIYHKRNVDFAFIPLPRLEIDKVDDLKTLFEIGALNPDISLGLTELLLGEELATGRKRMQLEQAGQGGGAAAAGERMDKLSGASVDQIKRKLQEGKEKGMGNKKPKPDDKSKPNDKPKSDDKPKAKTS